MGSHPIENIMQTTMENIRNMVDVNTIVGDTVVMGDGTVIIPISKVSFGFVAGGGEYGGDHAPQQQKQQDQQSSGKSGDFPFAGGTGAGVSISPMAFLVVSEGEVNLLPVQFSSSYERMMDRVPDLVCQLKTMFSHKPEGEQGQNGEEEPPEQGGKRRGRGWFGKGEEKEKKGEKSIFDEDAAVDETYRASKDEL